MKQTKVRPKIQNRPKTVLEKKQRLEKINPALNDLIKQFDLDLKL